MTQLPGAQARRAGQSQRRQPGSTEIQILRKACGDEAGLRPSQEAEPASGLVRVTRVRHSPVITSRSVVVRKVQGRARETVHGSVSRSTRSTAQACCDRAADRYTYSVVQAGTEGCKVKGLPEHSADPSSTHSFHI